MYDQARSTVEPTKLMKDTLGLAMLSIIGRLSSNVIVGMVLWTVSSMRVCPFLRGSFIGCSTVVLSFGLCPLNFFALIVFLQVRVRSVGGEVNPWSDPVPLCPY